MSSKIKSFKLFVGIFALFFLFVLIFLYHPFAKSQPPHTAYAVQLDSLSPTSGSIGTTVVIIGQHFTPQKNTVAIYGISTSNYGQHVWLYDQDSTNNSNRISITIPNRLIGNCQGTACSAMILPTRPGQYEISVSNANGGSNTLLFTVN